LQSSLWSRAVEFVGDHPGLVAFRVARAEDESDRTLASLFNKSVERLRAFGVHELRPVARLKLGPACRVVSEPLAQLRARTEVARPVVESELLLGPSTWPDPIHEDAAAIVYGQIVVGPLQSDVARA
jgi:hypothetical protein